MDRGPAAAVADMGQSQDFLRAKMPLIRDNRSAPIAAIFPSDRRAEMAVFTCFLTAGRTMVVLFRSRLFQFIRLCVKRLYSAFPLTARGPLTSLRAIPAPAIGLYLDSNGRSL